MKSLTEKEEIIMNFFWEKGEMTVREMLELYPEPKPHFNTTSTQIRMLEERGFVAHHDLGARCYKYYAAISRQEYDKQTLGNVIEKHFNNSYLGAVSCLVEEEKITLDELKELVRMVEGK